MCVSFFGDDDSAVNLLASVLPSTRFEEAAAVAASIATQGFHRPQDRQVRGWMKIKGWLPAFQACFTHVCVVICLSLLLHLALHWLYIDTGNSIQGLMNQWRALPHLWTYFTLFLASDIHLIFHLSIACENVRISFLFSAGIILQRHCVLLSPVEAWLSLLCLSMQFQHRLWPPVGGCLGRFCLSPFCRNNSLSLFSM